MIINSSIQGILLKKFLELKWSFFFNFRILKIIISGLITYFLTLYLSREFFNYDQTFILKMITFCTIGFSGAVCYAVSLLVFGEGKSLKKMLRRN
jgi:hypothetical protein